MSETLEHAWLYLRPKLAAAQLARLLEGSGDPIALIGPRRIGKTTYLLHDLTKAARARGFRPVYLDLWQHREAPMEAINYALEQALEDLAVPDRATAKNLKTPVKKLGAAGLSIELGEPPMRRRPTAPQLLVDWQIRALIREGKQPLMLMFDEVQTLAHAKGSEDAIAALRSALVKNKSAVRAVFTGSSREDLQALFTRARAPLYEGASLEMFPVLGDDFLGHVAALSLKRFGKSHPHADLKRAFEVLEHQPRALIDAVINTVGSGSKSVSAVAIHMIDALAERGEFDVDWHAFTPLQRAVLLRIAAGVELSSSTALQAYSGRGKPPVSPGSVNSALMALRKRHIIRKLEGQRGQYAIDDLAFRAWLQKRTEPRTSE
jgi:hypothetical protein